MNTTTRQIRNVLKAAMEMHRSGQLEAAAKLYESVLSHDENNAEALHWLGLLHHQAGDHVTAVQLIGRAVELRPSAHLVPFESGRGVSLRSASSRGRRRAAGRLSALWPDYPEALCNLGAALRTWGAMTRPSSRSAAP